MYAGAAFLRLQPAFLRLKPGFWRLFCCALRCAETQGRPEPPRAAQSRPEPPRAAQSRPAPPRAPRHPQNLQFWTTFGTRFQRRPESPRAAQSRPAPPTAAQSRPEPPGAAFLTKNGRSSGGVLSGESKCKKPDVFKKNAVLEWSTCEFLENLNRFKLREAPKGS